MNQVRTVVAVVVLSSAGVQVALAVGPKDKPYPFTESPLAVFDRLHELKLGSVAPLSAEERKLLSEAWNQKSGKESPALSDAQILDAMLFASGVESAEQLQKRRERFEAVVETSRKALEGVGDKKGVGERLMQHLHKTVMNKGYKEHQSSFAEVFDSNTYNCVSSTAMYYLVGRRLGLDLRPISISGGSYLPGHATLDMIDGKDRIEVEATNPDGFDWKAKTSKPGVIVLGFVPDRKSGREVDALGVAAMIYQNRTVECLKAEPMRPLEAARNGLLALALDPNDEGMTNNLLSVFVNLGPSLAKEKKFEDAIRVLHFGLSFAPKNHDLRNNAAYVWWHYFRATMEEGKDEDAVKVAARAIKALPNESGFKNVAELFTRFGDTVYKDGDYEAALKVAERAVKALPKDDSKQVVEWRGHTFLLWSQKLLDKKDVEGSFKVVIRAYKLDPKDKSAKKAVSYHAYCTLDLKEADLKTVASRFKRLRESFPDVDDVVETASGRVIQEVDRLVEEKRFQEAVDFANQAKVMLERPKDQAEVLAVAYDYWARDLAKDKKWRQAIDKYKEGLSQLPKQDRLVTNGLATVHDWAREFVRDEKWDEAAQAYKIGFEIRPGDGIIESNIKTCNERKAEKK